MVGNRSTGLSLFELLARVWTLGDEIVQIEFNHDDTAALFRLASGKLAMMYTTDEESSGSRTRVHVDTGQTTIRKRKNPIPAAEISTTRARPGLPVVRCGLSGFIVINVEELPFCITNQGERAVDFDPVATEITAICSSRTGDTLAVAGQSGLSVYLTKDMSLRTRTSHDHAISCMAFSVCGKFLATWGESCLCLVNLGDPTTPPIKINGMDNVTQLTWNRTTSHVACASSANEFHIVDVHAGTVQTVKDYPDRVTCAVFSEKGKALVTSGAYRVAGWSTDDLPRNDQPGTPLTTGKPGLVVINTVAAHPDRALVAAGYANGLVTIASIGSTQEMMIHQEPGTEVKSLCWSSSGEHLAIGFKSGKAAIVTFPEQLFK